MNLVILGKPASGKGTFSNYITEKYGFTHIAMGDLLRASVTNGHRHAKIIANAIKNGQIVDEYISSDIIKDYLQKNNLNDNIIIDGYPRGILSAHLLEKFLKIDAVLRLDISDEAIKQRVRNRMQCVDCGKSFNMLDYTADFCDVCNGKLVKRVDDTIEVLEQRLKAYNASTLPVFDFYKKKGIVYSVNADCSIKDGKKGIDKVLKKIQNKIDKENSICNKL